MPMILVTVSHCLCHCLTLLVRGSNNLCVKETKIKKGIYNLSLWSESISERQTPPQTFTNTKLVKQFWLLYKIKKMCIQHV